MLRLVAFAILSYAPVLSVTASDILGRWRSNTAPTGYWIVDRYADGRFAKRQYLRLDYAKPAELTLEWGRWKLSGSRYSETIQGTTSPTLMRFANKRLTWRVLGNSTTRFSFESHDGQPRVEERIAADAPLLQIKTPPPKDEPKNQLIDTISGSHEKIPSWINSVPPPTASNKTLQPTALGRCASVSILITVFSTAAQPRSQSGG